MSQLPRLDPESQARVHAAWHRREVAPFLDLKTVVPGSVTAPLAGGNLTVLGSLVGTPFAAKFEGKIVILEDVGEPAYRVDRLIKQLLLGGGLSQATGLVLGDFTDISQSQVETIRHHLHRVASELGIPSAEGLPIGHGERNAPLPNGDGGGWLATLNAVEGGAASLSLDRHAS